MKLFITGIYGNLGESCANYFSSIGFEVSGLTKSIKSHKYFNEKINIVLNENKNNDLINELILESDIILHFASSTGFDKQDYEYIDSNFTTTVNLLNILKTKKNNIKKIIYASTSSVYAEGQYKCANHGVFDDIQRNISDLNKKIWDIHCPYCLKKLTPMATDEKCKTKSIHMYAITKKMSEIILENFSLVTGIETIILRFSSLFGYKFNQGIIPLFIDKVKKNEKIIINEDGNQKRDFFTYEEATKCIHEIIINKTENSLYNLSSGNEISINHLIKLISNNLGMKSNLEVNNSYRLGDVRNIFLNNNLFTNEFKNIRLNNFSQNLNKCLMKAMNAQN